VADVPLTFEHDHLMTPLVINDHSVNMVFDTGSTGTTLSKQAAHRVHAHIFATMLAFEGIGGSNQTYFFTTKSIQLGNMQGGHATVAVEALNPSFEQYHIDGLLGADMLSSLDVDLDLPDHRALLYKIAGDCHRPRVVLAQPLYVMPMLGHPNLLDSRAIIAVSIAGHLLKALIDTGSPTTLLYWDAARRIGLKDADVAHDPRFPAGGVGPRDVEALQHKLATMDIGDINVRNLPVTIVNQASPGNHDMILGLDFLNRVHAWLSFETRTVVIQYPPSPSPPRPS
jgi:predicted aspartyl protease